MEGKEFCGNFWPAPIYKNHFGRDIPKAEIITYEGKKGTMLGSDTPMVPGVIQLSNISRKKVFMKTDLPTSSTDSGDVLARAKKKLRFAAKECVSTRGGGDDEGKYLKVSAPSQQYKADEDLRENDDPFDFLFSPTIKGPKANKDTEGDGDTGSTSNTKSKSPKAGERGGKAQGVKKEKPPKQTPHGVEKEKASTPEGKLAGGPSYRDRQKQVAAVDSARKALLDAEQLLNKLEDTMLAQSVTDKHLSVVDKKVSEALAPSKVQLITSTMDFSALASMDSGSTEAMVVLDSLRDISKRLKGATLLVAANAKLASIDAVALRLAIDTADLAGIKVPMKYLDTVLKLAGRVYFDNCEFEAWACLLKFDAAAAQDPTSGGKCDIYYACRKDAAVAKDLQTQHGVARILELLRIVDIRDEAATLTKLKSFAAALNSVPWLDSDFSASLKPFVDIMACFGDQGVQLTMLDKAKAARDLVFNDPNHRLHKPLKHLPGGILIIGLVDAASLQVEADNTCKTKVDTLIAKLETIQAYAQLEDEKDASPIKLPDKARYVEAWSEWQIIQQKASQDFKSSDTTAPITTFFADLGSAVLGRVTRFNVAILEAGLSQLAGASKFTSNKSADAKNAIKIAQHSLASLATASSLGLQTFLDEPMCKAVDDSAEQLKRYVNQLIGATAVLAAEKIDLKNPALVEFAATNAEWNSLAQTYQENSVLLSIRAGLRTTLQTELAKLVAGHVNAYETFAWRMCSSLLGSTTPGNIMKQHVTHDLVGDIIEFTGESPLRKMLASYSAFLGNACPVKLTPPSSEKANNSKAVPFSLVCVVDAFLPVAQHFCHADRNRSAAANHLKETPPDTAGFATCLEVQS